MNNLKRLVDKSNVPEDATCPICYRLMFGARHDAQLFNPCSHLLCKECDTKVKDKCPICRSERKGCSKVHKKLRDEIGQLNAFCKGEGCSVEGKLQELPKHESTCYYCQHCCQYCSRYFPKGVNHENKCWFSCMHCQEKLLYKDITPNEHAEKCPKFPVCCSSKDVGCEKKVKREELEAHLRTCPFHQIRNFLKVKQLQFDKIKLQMLTVQKSEMYIRKEHLSVIVKHQKLLRKYQTLYKEHVQLMETVKNETKKERNRLLLVKKTRGMEVKYIKLSEQYMLLGERNRKLQQHILGADQQLRREAIETAMSENRSNELNRLLEEFLTNARVECQLHQAELSKSYKSFLSIHEDQIKERFENMLRKSGELFIALYGDVYKKDSGLADAIKTMKDDDFNFLRQYQKLLSDQVSIVSTLFGGFMEKHMGIQERQLDKLSSCFGWKNILFTKNETPRFTFEDIDMSNIAPQVLRSYNIRQLKRKIQLLKGLRDGATPITEEVLRNAFEKEPVLAVIDSWDVDKEDETSPVEETNPVHEVNPDLKLDMNDIRLGPFPSGPNWEVNHRPDVDMVSPEIFGDEKEPVVISREEVALSDEKEQADEKEPINLSNEAQSNATFEPLGMHGVEPTGTNPPDPRRNNEQAIASASEEGSRHLSGTRSKTDTK